MKQFLILAVLLSSMAGVQAQKFMTKNGHIDFFARGVADIKATNNATLSIIDAGSGQIAFKTLINGFQFEKSLMQTHFNEDMQSKEFPDATFEGKITGLSLAADGAQDVTVAGTLKLHGVSRQVTVPGKITVAGGKITGAKAQFKVLLKDYQIPTRSGVPQEISINVDINNFSQQ